LTIEPLEALTSTSMDYDLTITVYSQMGDVYSLSRTLYWITGTGPSPGGDCEELVADLGLMPESLAIDHNTTSVYLTWSAVWCAGGYRIYAQDDRNNPNWVYLRDEPTDYETGTISAWCELPASFDRYQVDGMQTPFAGTAVTFCVVPERAADTNPGGEHGTVIVRDNVVPSLAQVIQIGNGYNDTGDDTFIEFKVLFSEYINPATEDPTIEFAESGGDPAFVLDPQNATWIWQNGRREGRFSFTLSPGQNATEDLYRVSITDMRDLAGNLAAGQTSSAWQTIEVWGAQFDFETSTQGWTRTGQGWEWGIPTIGPGGAHSGTRCWGTTLNAQYQDNWDTSLSSPEIYVPATSPYLEFWCWYETDSYDDFVYVYVDHDGGSEQIARYDGYQSEWQLKTFNLSSYANERVQIRFRFTSDSYGTYQGFFLDDVRVYSTAH
jgi:hypothetical protein